ncbi:MAG: VOC family protein [Actinomycetota bacterium]|jgi:catechol 2,3-dioxygenase-like lactoylglutathione lyase family enzyme|nr:VOC family protein [Actinomycetota bacterium]
MIRAIHHTAISTGDIEASLRFYRDLLGFCEVDQFRWRAGSSAMDAITALTDSAAKVALLRLDNAFLELFEYTSPQPEEADPNRPVCDHGITHLCLEVVDIDAEYERLSAAGMMFHSPPIGGGLGVRATYGRDPDGNVVELLEVSDDSPLAL